MTMRLKSKAKPAETSSIKTDSDIATMLFIGDLQCTAPRMQSKLTGITTGKVGGSGAGYYFIPVVIS